MDNPFNRVSNSEDKTRYYAKSYDAADDVLNAVSLANGVAFTILRLAARKMDFNNECDVVLKDLDKALGIKDSETRTKALNILRLMNLVEISNDNRKGMSRFRINAKAFYRFADESLAKKNCFNGELNFKALDDNGFIKKSAIEEFRVSQKAKDAKLKSDIDESIAFMVPKL